MEQHNYTVFIANDKGDLSVLRAFASGNQKKAEEQIAKLVKGKFGEDVTFVFEKE